jgi:flagellar motility protein MotE (MotC chaperone)
MRKIKFYHISGAGALVIAACSAVFSVYGLSTLFAGSRLPVIIMTSALELGKILSVSMVYNYAKKLPKLIQRYLITAIVVLMFITSLGAYGYLANAYQKSSDRVAATTTSQSYNTEQQNLIGERINNLRQQISRDTTRLDTLNSQRNAQETRLNQAQVALNRRMQDQARQDITKSDAEIKTLTERIDSGYDNIAKENDKLSTLKADNFKIREEDRKIDVGPLRYLTKLLSSSMDSIVTILILILVFVFDPLAVVLWLSTNTLIKAERDEEKRLKPKTITVEKMPDTLDGFKNLMRKFFNTWKEQKQKEQNTPK